MADELGILIKAGLGDYSDLTKGIKALEAKIDPIKIKLDLGDAQKFVDTLKQANNILNKSQSSASSSSSSLAKAFDVKSIQNSITALNRYYNTMKKLESSRYSGLSVNTSSLTNAANNVLANLDRGQNEGLEELRKQLSLVTGQIQQFDQQVRNANFDEQIERQSERAATHIKNLQTQLRELLENNKNLSSSSKNRITSAIEEMQQALNGGNLTMRDSEKYSGVFATIRRDITATGETVDTFSSKIQKLFGEHMNTAIAMAGIHALQQAMQSLWQSIQDVDAAMTELKKVTDESDATYNKFLSNASTRAKELGASMSDIIQSTADFARLGYTLEEATTLADVATVYKNVADGLDDINEASQSIISTMKAFNIEAKDSMSIADMYNKVIYQPLYA